MEDEDIIYRYRAINEYTIDDLRLQRITGCTADLFNDPRECEVNVSIDKVETLLKTVPGLHAALEKYCRDCGIPIELFLRLKKSEMRDDIMKSHISACFTPNPFNHAMWAHYADNHRGIAIGYAKSDIEIAIQEACAEPGNDYHPFLYRKNPLQRRLRS